MRSPSLVDAHDRRSRRTPSVADSEKSKSAPLPWVILSGVLGLFAVSAPRPAGDAPSVAKPAEKKEASADGVPRFSGRDPLKPIHDFYATHDGTWDPEDDLRNAAQGYETEFLIATVPDPIDSTFGSSFDQVVEAIQRAVERKDGYILDRAWLPWELDRKTRPKPTDDPTDMPSLRESCPGVLLFRHGRDKSRNITRPGLCVVFLVGETPLGGLHKRAFTRALRLMAKTGHPPEKPVRIVGPFFPGSQTALQFVITDWWGGGRNPLLSWLPVNPPYRFQVLTGNATAIRKTDFFNLKPPPGLFEGVRMVSAGAEGPGIPYPLHISHTPAEREKEHVPAALPSLEPPAVELASTIAPTQLTISAILHYLTYRDSTSSTDAISNVLGELPGKVAILTEANTSLGKQVTSLESDRLVVLRFPMHISRVRSESAEAFRRKEEQSGLKQGDLLVGSLHDEPTPQGEGVPSQGGAATGAANGQVLASILSTIAREQCRYVGVVATDTRDKLFLIRIIREYCPDVHVFATGSDVLLAHPEYRYHMRGVFIGSTYPLFPPNQRWVKPDSRERILFPTVGAQGYYNAALIHLGLTQHLLEYGPPSFALRPDSADDDAARERPPIWISMVAPNGALVPLQVFSSYHDKWCYQMPVPAAAQRDPDAAATPAGYPPPLEFPGSLLPFGVALFGFWVYLIFLAYVRRSPQFFWPAVRQSAGDLASPNVFYRNLVLGSQVILTLPVFAVTVTQARSQHWDFTGTVMTALVGLAALLMTFALFQPLLRRDQRRELLGRGKLREYPLDRWLWRLLLVLSVASVLAFAVLFLGRYWSRGDTALRVLFFVRAVDLSTGLSPLTPLFFMCLTFAAWGYFQLKRIQLADRYSVATPYPEPRPGNNDE